MRRISGFVASRHGELGDGGQRRAHWALRREPTHGRRREDQNGARVRNKQHRSEPKGHQGRERGGEQWSTPGESRETGDEGIGGRAA